MTRPVLLLCVVGLSRRRIGASTPRLRELAERGDCAPMRPVLPAVTGSAQASMLTGLPPSGHGAVGNGWLFRDLGEVWLWRQSNALVRGEKLYEAARRRDPSFTCAKLFWWWNMGAAVDWSITPKPFYGADGSKAFAVYGRPDELRAATERELGPFPFHSFWGPRAGLPSSRWIAAAAIRTLGTYRPSLTMAYLPHLDYDHQRFGPDSPEGERALREVDAVVGELVDAADEAGAATVVVSEYALEEATRPIRINRVLREEGFLRVRDGPFGEALDVFASEAFAVADHQVAHVYVREVAGGDRARVLRRSRNLLSRTDGVAEVLFGEARARAGLDHPNAGDVVAVAERGAWFTYDYWLDERRAPDFARTVDIHRKPGYDPCELFVDPELRLPALRVAARLARKKLGFRYLMDVVPLDPTLVKGTHGRIPDDPEDGPVWISSEPMDACGGEPPEGFVETTSVKDRVLALLGLAEAKPAEARS